MIFSNREHEVDNSFLTIGQNTIQNINLIVNLFLIDQLFNSSSTVLHFEDRFSMLSSLIATVVSSTKSVKFDRLDKD